MSPIFVLVLEGRTLAKKLGGSPKVLALSTCILPLAVAIPRCFERGCNLVSQSQSKDKGHESKVLFVLNSM